MDVIGFLRRLTDGLRAAEINPGRQTIEMTPDLRDDIVKQLEEAIAVLCTPQVPDA
jgi:hypothetical protein